MNNETAVLDYVEYLKFLDLEEGVIRFAPPINTISAEILLSELSHLQRVFPPTLTRELTIYLSSPGGNAYASLAVYDGLCALKRNGFKLTVIAEGLVASAAAMILLQAADERVATKHSHFLLHGVKRWATFPEGLSEMKDIVKQLKQLEDQMLSILAPRCSKTKQDIRRFLTRKDVWMSAEEALEWGLVDKIM